MQEDKDDATIGDQVDKGLDEWKATEFDYPVLTIELLARLGRVRGHIEKSLASIYDTHGLTAPEFYVLATLMRHPPHFSQTQAVVARALNLTAGTVSVRVAAMVDKGLLEISTGEQGRMIAATADGAERFEQTQEALRFHQDRLFSPLDNDQREQLAVLLRRLGLDYETENQGGSRPYPPLGVDLVPAHIARQQRAQVGLSDRIGLLVAAADDTTKIAVGDLLTHANGEPVISVLDLAAAEPIHQLTVRRGERKHSIDLNE